MIFLGQDSKNEYLNEEKAQGNLLAGVPYSEAKKNIPKFISDVHPEALKISGKNQGIAASMLGLIRNALNKRLLRKKK